MCIDPVAEEDKDFKTHSCSYALMAGMESAR